MSESNVLNKTSLSKLIAAETGFSEEKSSNTITAICNAVTAALKAGDDVTLIGFGSFSVSKVAAKKGRNPQTKAVITIKASNRPKFKAGKALKDAVNGN